MPKKGTCDIFFPTHFRTLEHFYHAVAANVKPNRQTTSIRHQVNPESPQHQSTNEQLAAPQQNQTTNKPTQSQTTNELQYTNGIRKRNTRILSNRNFMKLYANLEHTTTASGFNPLLEDYVNMTFFVSESKSVH